MRFPDHFSANQLLDCRCSQGGLQKLMEWLEPSSGSKPSVRQIQGHDADTLHHLQPVLLARGWHTDQYGLMLCEEYPRRTASPEVQIQVVDPAADQEFTKIALASGAAPGAHAFRQAQDTRLGGEGLVAWLDGEPVGYGGWYVVDRIARFRRLGVVPEARGRGVGTTLVRYVQEHPCVRAQDALVIVTSRSGRQAMLYRDLGFIERGVLWVFYKPN
jgi:ribosomal protein S18 acetylase RimI-like enzyme